MSNETGRLIGAAAAVVAILGIGGILTDHVQPAMADPRVMSTVDQEKMEKIAASSLFGQFRTSMCDYLWLKADKYMHRGVDLRGLTEQEKQQDNADKVATNPNDPIRIKHREETTVVPSKDRDWRGHLGDIEREVSPYMDMSNHSHADAGQTLPLFRLMTWSNPHFVKGYLVGSTLIDVDSKHADEAIAFLKEGETNNPESFELKTELGFCYTRKKKQYDLGMTYLNQAFQLISRRDPSTLNEDEKDAWQSIYRWAVMNRREAGDHVAARRIAIEGLKLFPNDIVCKGYLKKYGG